jgi:hypothetical protein
MRLTTQITFFSLRAVLFTWIVSLCCTLQGCAPVFMTAPSPPAANAATDSPGGIRVLCADQRFAEVSVQSVARRARTLRGEESISILVLSGVSVADVGAAGINAEGEVYNLTSPADLAGNYSAVTAGITIIEGGSVAYLKNEKGVVIKLHSQTGGLRFNLSANGMHITL